MARTTGARHEPPREAEIAALIMATGWDKDGQETAGRMTAYKAARLADTLCRLGDAHRRACEHLCSYPDESGRVEKRRARLEQKAAEAVAGVQGAVLHTQGDPRGTTLRIKFDGVQGDGWSASEGHGLYRGRA